jgi:hypothetical protein
MEDKITMKKKSIQGCLTWMAIFVLIFVAGLGFLFIARPDVAYAVQDIASTTALFARVEVEIMLPTPHGRYYSDLYWKHYVELGKILRANPSYRDDMYRLMRLFVPNIEAALEGRGDEIQITQYQVDELQAFIDEIWAAAGEELRADIERELFRTPLQDYVGMTMEETQEYIESMWKRDFIPPPAPTEDGLAIQTMTPTP